MGRWKYAIGSAVFLAAAAAGYAVTRPLAGLHLRGEIERVLGEQLGTEVRVAAVHLALGWGIELRATGIRAWPGPDGARFAVDRARVGIRPLGLLGEGSPIGAIRLVEPVLRVERTGDGSFEPQEIGALLAGPPTDSTPEHPRELLQPLIAVETALRELLESDPSLRSLEIVGGRIAFSDRSTASAREVSFENVRLRLAHGFLGESEAELRLRVHDATGERGTLEANARLDRLGSLRLAAAGTELELRAIGPWLHAVRPGSRLDGRLSGAVVFESRAPGHGTLELDLLARDFESTPTDGERALRSERVVLTGVLAVEPARVRLEHGRLLSDRLALVLDGSVERPIHDDSKLSLSLALHDVSVADVRNLIDWLPDVERDEAAALVRPIERGRLQSLRTAGSATLSGWLAFLAGRTGFIPRDFVVDAQLADATVRVGDDDRLESLSGRLWWAGDRIEIRGAESKLNGSPLPRLDLAVDGVSHLFASAPTARRVRPGARPLEGLQALWLATQGKDDEPSSMQELTLEVEHVEHPMFFWPIAETSAHVEPLAGGVRIGIERGLWAGVPVSGEADWLFEPSEQVSAHFVAVAPEREAPPRTEDEAWARGRFELGRIETRGWSQKRAAGRFRAEGARVHIADVEAELRPRGAARLAGSLDLGQRGRVPADLSFAVEDADLPTLAELFEIPRELSTGTVEAAGSLSGRLEPGAPLSRSLDGLVEIELSSGTIRRELPAFAAVALSSSSINPFAQRDHVRFDRITTALEFEAGHMRTESLTLEGPDVRAFASGQVDMTTSPHALDVELVLFLFRPVDAVIDKIPLLNVLLLGTNRNLLAAHYALGGSWEDPSVRLVPHKSLATGVLETMPTLVRKGLRALDALLGDTPG